MWLTATLSRVDRSIDSLAITVEFDDQLFGIIPVEVKRFHEVIDSVGFSDFARRAVLPCRSRLIVGHLFSSHVNGCLL